MKFYNTLSKKVEEFIPNEEGKVKMYTCGPTVYHYAHIGNLRTYINEDILEKTLNYLGYNVTRCMNITDVGHLTSDADTGEDKMLKGAKREHKSVLDIAKFYTDSFKNDCEKLNIKWPEIVVPATTQIDEYILFIQDLEKKGYTYNAGGNVYFDTSKLKVYYWLTNQNEEDLKEAVREDVEVDTNKKNKNDFVLWFTKSKFDDQELKWDSPWGYGYPGWHIECSSISLKYLGEYLDIHCGGVDNIFPHHTNEIAQTESRVGHKWCNYWFHPEHLNDQTGKMSKSNGEFLTVSLLEEKGYNPLDYRFMCLNSHYHKQLLFTFDNLDSARNQYQKLLNKIRSLNPLPSDGLEFNYIHNYQEKFKEALENDLNTSSALTILFDVLKDACNDKTKEYIIGDFDQVLSLDLLKKEEKNIDSNLEEYINKKIEERKQAKINKNYDLADQIRKELEDKGIILKDTREGTTYELK